MVIYSISHKMMVYLKSSSWATPVTESLDFPWRITTQVSICYLLLCKINPTPEKITTNTSIGAAQKYTPHCNNLFEENTGTIKSPNYPILYPNSIDCRWSIKVEPGSKVRLLFAFFETQTNADFLFVSIQITTFISGIASFTLPIC